MPRVSKFPLTSKNINDLKEQFAYLISSLNNKNEVENFLNEFFTNEEKIMLTKRLILFMMMKQKLSPTNIQASLHVSYETVRTYQMQFQFKSGLFQKTIERLIKRKETKEFLDKLNKAFKPIGLALRAKTDMKARAQISEAWKN